MKLTQELVVTIVFLGGSWVTLSVVAVAFPPATSSIRAAISNTQVKHIKVASPLMASSASLPAEDVLPTEDTTTFLQDEKHDVVQVVATDTKKDELFILAENDAVPEKLIEDHPDAKMIVVGADETTAKSKLDKFNLTAKNVAIRVALAKQAATRQAQADFAKLRDWCENGSHFALEVKDRRFEFSVHDVLKGKLEEVADMPELNSVNAQMKALPATQYDHSNTAQSSQVSMLQNKLMTWRDNSLRFASTFSVKEELHQMISYLEGNGDKPQSAPATQSQPTINSAAVPKEDKAGIRSPDLRPLNEKLTLEFKAKPFEFIGPQPLNPVLTAMTAGQHEQPAAAVKAASVTVAAKPAAAAAVAKPAPVAVTVKPAPVAMTSFELPTIDNRLSLDTSAHHYTLQDRAVLSAALTAMNDHEADLPLASAVVYKPAVEPIKAIIATQSAKTVIVNASVNAVVNPKPAASVPVQSLPQAIVAMTETKISYSPVPADMLKTAEVKTDKQLDINKVHAATTKVLQQSAKVAVKKEKSAAQIAVQVAAAKALHLKQLAAADAKHRKAVARENAIASLERQLANEPAVIVVPAKPAHRQRIASAESSHQQTARPQHQPQPAPRVVQQQPIARNEESQQMLTETMARRQPVEKDPFEEYFEQQEQNNREMSADRQTTNVASMDQAPSDEEARDISGDMHRPEEYSRLMEE